MMQHGTFTFSFVLSSRALVEKKISFEVHRSKLLLMVILFWDDSLYWGTYESANFPPDFIIILYGEYSGKSLESQL